MGTPTMCRCEVRELECSVNPVDDCEKRTAGDCEPRAHEEEAPGMYQVDCPDEFSREMTTGEKARVLVIDFLKSLVIVGCIYPVVCILLILTNGFRLVCGWKEPRASAPEEHPQPTGWKEAEG